MTGTDDDDLGVSDIENLKPQVRTRRPAKGLPLIGVWAEIPKPRSGYTIRCIRACANLAGAQEYLSRLGASLVENRTAITWSVREFRTHPVKRPRPDRAPRIRITEQNIIEIGS
ncbi:hypothetical protein AruPA_17475 [Acidiphilium sp. PA]|uniref:hypothetical protein n=1 Tax=Acidiphilium sp. PA TaxID=2871705 RepID=UPI0022440EA4|nr:hypothetical protein [Acidiphilium sp. PA]MCW8308827.1 hypothetical protein [Acidiphilium sp. PA]